MLSLVSAGQASSTIGLQAAKDHLRVDGTEHDDRVQAILMASIGFVGEAAGRSLIRNTWRLALPGIQGDLSLPMPPVGEVADISIYAPDGTDTALDVADFYLFAGDDSATLRPKSGAWPATAVRDDAFRITFTAGYVTPPVELSHAVMVMVEREYDRLTGADAAGFDRTISALIASRRIGWVAA